MGHTQAAAFAEAVADGEVSLEAALEYHLTANHFPPIPRSVIPVAVKVIELANVGEFDADVELPDGITYRDGRSSAPVWACCEAWHLDAFLEPDEAYIE